MRIEGFKSQYTVMTNVFARICGIGKPTLYTPAKHVTPIAVQEQLKARAVERRKKQGAARLKAYRNCLKGYNRA